MDVFLQQRGGRNYAAFWDMIQGLNVDILKLTVNELVVLEGSDDLKFGELPGNIIGSFLGGGSSFISLKNNTGGDITASLFLVDKYGSEAELDVEVISNGDTGQLEAILGSVFGLLFLSKGDKLVVRVAENVLAGNGATMSRGVARLASGFFERVTVNEKLTQPTFRYKEEPGRTAAGVLYTLFNMSSSQVDHIYARVYKGDTLIDEYADFGPLAAGDSVSVPLVGFEDIETEVQFDSLPADGYLYGAINKLIPANAVECSTPLNGS